MAGYVFEGAGAMTSSTAGAAILTPALPSAAADRLRILFTGARATETLTVSGWVDLAIGNTGSLKLFGRISQVGDTAPSVAWSGTSASFAQIAEWSGDVYTDLNSILTGSANLSNTGTLPNFPALTVAQGSQLIIVCAKRNKTSTDDGASMGSVAGFTNIGSDVITGVGNIAVWAYQIQTAAANIVTDSWVMTGATESVARNGSTVSLQSNTVTPSTAGSMMLMHCGN